VLRKISICYHSYTTLDYSGDELPYLAPSIPVLYAREYFLPALSTTCFFSGYFLNEPQQRQRRSDGPGANVNQRNLWLNPVLNAVLRVSIVSPYVFNITAELKMAARRRGEDIIDFSMGNPDGATPPHIVEKLCTVAQRPDTHGYSTSRGIPRLRRAISRWYEERYNVDIDPESEAIVTIGSKEGLAHLMLATLDHGDTVLVPNPSYPIHIYGAVIAGAQVRSVPLVEGWISLTSWNAPSARVTRSRR
jgi:DNA-binding transcriptional MocR family regulator